MLGPRPVARATRSNLMTPALRGAPRSTRLVRAALGLMVLLAACHPTRGCAEAQFDLSPASRLPRWFTLPGGVERADVEVSLSYYVPLIGSDRTATVTLRTRRGRTLQQVVATLRGREPQTLQPYAGSGRIPYPGYEILTANGITEVVEHRRMEPVFYITEDSEVRLKLGVPD
jgi:hypothetical protein